MTRMNIMLSLLDRQTDNLTIYLYLFLTVCVQMFKAAPVREWDILSELGVVSNLREKKGPRKEE